MFKYIIVGDSGVGKSSLLLRLTENRFQSNHDFTIGVDFGTKMVEIGPKQTKVKLQIWDTAGQENFRSITRGYYRGISGAILVYDVCNRESFNHINRWLNDVLNANSNHKIGIILIGNKADLEYNQCVSTQEGQDLANRHNILFAETSARNENNVSNAFNCLSERILNMVITNEIDDKQEDSGVKLGQSHQKSLKLDNNKSFPSWCCFT